MSSVALIGVDGAGKTTVAKALLASGLLPMKYVYMGFGTRSSNFALPTSRLVLMLKRRLHYRQERASHTLGRHDIPASSLEYDTSRHGLVWAICAFLNRMAEAWYRQAISTAYQMRGYLVLYDRHLVFDSACELMISGGEEGEINRLCYRILSRWLPKPQLAILLDAPAEVLFERKQDTMREEVTRRREALLKYSKTVRNLVIVDASQSFSKVLSDVTAHISSRFGPRSSSRPNPTHAAMHMWK